MTVNHRHGLDDAAAAAGTARRRGQPRAGGDPGGRVRAVGAAGVAGRRRGASPAAPDRSAGGGRVHDQLPHVHVHADLLRPARQPRARRRLAGQHRHPGLCLRPHARDGQRGGDALRAGVRRAQAGHAGRVPAAFDGAPDGHRRAPRRGLRLLGAHPRLPRRVGAHRPRRRRVRVRAHPADLRVRGQLPDPEVPAGAEHRGAQRLHLHGDAGAAPGAHLARRRPPRDGSPRRRARAQPQLVDHRAGAVWVHRHQPQVQGDVDGVHLAGVPQPRQLLQALGGVRRDAVSGDVVLPDPRAHRRPAQEPRALPRLPLHMHDHQRMGVHDLRGLQRRRQRAGRQRARRGQPEGGGLLGGGGDVAVAGRGGGVRRRRALHPRPAQLLLHGRRGGGARGVRPLPAARRHARPQRRAARALRRRRGLRLAGVRGVRQRGLLLHHRCAAWCLPRLLPRPRRQGAPTHF